MSTLDVVAVAVAAVVTTLVCVAFVARTRHEPATARTPVALGLAAGLSALVAVLAVHLVGVAGQGDPLGTLGDLVTTGAGALVRPATLVAVALAAAAGVVVGRSRVRGSQGSAS